MENKVFFRHKNEVLKGTLLERQKSGNCLVRVPGHFGMFPVHESYLVSGDDWMEIGLKLSLRGSGVKVEWEKPKAIEKFVKERITVMKKSDTLMAVFLDYNTETHQELFRYINGTIYFPETTANLEI